MKSTIDTLETERLILRKLTYDDAESIYHGWASDPEVTKYVTWDYHRNIETTRLILDMWMKQYDDPKTVRFGIALKSNNELIGMIDVVDFATGIPEIGYCLSRQYWNQGYMSEACQALIKYLFLLGYPKIVIEAEINNIGSNRVIQKCGFKFTRIEKKEELSKQKNKEIIVNWYEIDSL